MRALKLVAVGLVVVFVDLSVDGFDVVADPVGWGLVLAGLAQVRSRHRGFAVAHAASVVALVLSVLEVLAGMGLGPTYWPALLGILADLGVVAGTCLALGELLRQEDPRSAKAARTILGLDVLATAVALPVFGLTSASTAQFPFFLQAGAGGVMSLLFVLTVLAGLVARVWLVVLLLRVADAVEPGRDPVTHPGPEPGAQPSGV